MFWIGLVVATSMVAAYHGLIAGYIWLRSRAVLGPTSPESRDTLHRLLDISRQGPKLRLIRLVLLYSGIIGSLILAIVAKEWFGLIFAAAPFLIIVWMDVRTKTVPVVLVLGTSNISSVKRQRAIKLRLSPLRVVSLLDVDVPWDTNLSNEMHLDCFRTTNEADWWLTITRLMEIAPILAIDAAAETEGVLKEGQHILGTDLWQKCLFLTPPDGTAPVLDRLLSMEEMKRRGLRIVPYDQATKEITLMVDQLSS